MSVVVRMIDMPMAIMSAIVMTEGIYQVLVNKGHPEDVRTAAVSGELNIIRDRYHCDDEPRYDDYGPGIR